MNASLIRCTETNARTNHINQKATFLNINIVREEAEVNKPNSFVTTPMRTAVCIAKSATKI